MHRDEWRLPWLAAAPAPAGRNDPAAAVGSAAGHFGPVGGRLCIAVWAERAAVPLPNPLPVPVVDLDFAWEQIVAVVEENFKIQHEERVRLCGDILTEGRIDTVPLTAATLLESWRSDSVTFRDRLISTLQSRRRRCYVARDSRAGSILGRSARRR